MKYATKKKKIISRIEWQQIGNTISVQLETKIPKIGTIFTTNRMFTIKGHYPGSSVAEYNPMIREYRPSKSKKKS